MNDNEKAELANYFVEVRKYFDDNANATKKAINDLTKLQIIDRNLLFLLFEYLTESDNKADFTRFLERVVKSESYDESLKNSAQETLNGVYSSAQRGKTETATRVLRVLEGGLQSPQQSYPPSPDDEEDMTLPTLPHSDT